MRVFLRRNLARTVTILKGILIFSVIWGMGAFLSKQEMSFTQNFGGEISSEAQLQFDGLRQQLWPREFEIQKVATTLQQFFASDHLLLEEVIEIVAPEFQGHSFSDAILSSEASYSTFTRKDYHFKQAPYLGQQEFVQAYIEWRRQQMMIKNVDFNILESDKIESELILWLWLSITSFKHDQVATHQGKVAVSLKPYDNQWKITSFWIEEWQAISGELIFSEESLPGFDIRNLDEEMLESPGNTIFPWEDRRGVSLVDWDQDHDLDLYIPLPGQKPLMLENEGGFRFKQVPWIGDKVESSEVAWVPQVGYFVDLDQDGDQDLWEMGLEGGRVYEQKAEQQWVLRDVNAGKGWTSASFVDYDQDGDLDIYLTRTREVFGDEESVLYSRGASNLFLENQGSFKFQNQTRKLGLSQGEDGASVAAAWGDVDEDGHLDLYIVNQWGHNTLYRWHPKQGKYRRDVRTLKNEDAGFSMGAEWVDYDQDGQLDLWVANVQSVTGKRVTAEVELALSGTDRAAMTKFSVGNRWLLRKENKSYAVLERPLTHESWPTGYVFFDYDADGSRELYMGRGWRSPSEEEQELQRIFWASQVMSYQGMSEATALSKEDTQGAQALGKQIFLQYLQSQKYAWAGFQTNQVFTQEKVGAWTDIAAILGLDDAADVRGATAGDIDLDGDLDLVVITTQYPYFKIYKNNQAFKNHYLSLKLRKPHSLNQQNADLVSQVSPEGLGARVRVTCGGHTQVQQVPVGGGSMGQHPKEVWFGLGGCEVVDRIEIQWFPEYTQHLHNIASNQRLWVTAGEDEYKTLKQARLSKNGLSSLDHILMREVLEEDMPLRYAPSWTLKRASGGSLDYEESFHSQVLILGLWTTWCYPCIQQMQQLESWLTRAEEVQVQIAGIFLDGELEAEKVRRLKEHHNISYPLLLGQKQLWNAFMEENVPHHGLPVLLVIHKGHVYQDYLRRKKYPTLTNIFQYSSTWSWISNIFESGITTWN